MALIIYDHDHDDHDDYGDDNGKYNNHNQVLSLSDNQLHRLDPAAFRPLGNLKR